MCETLTVSEFQAEAEIDEEEHTNLYRHISGEYEGPMYNLVYKADAPIDIKSVFYVPQMNLVRRPFPVASCMLSRVGQRF